MVAIVILAGTRDLETYLNNNLSRELLLFSIRQ